MRRGVYPGSFDPPTVAHLAVADAARWQGALDRLDLVLSTVALGKDAAGQSAVAERLRALERLTSGRRWLGATVTDRQLLVDVAEGYDLLVVGADKWAQLVDPRWYGGSTRRRDDALRRLPPVLVAPRPPHPLPELTGPVAGHLELDPTLAAVSSTAVRAGRREWMALGPGGPEDAPGAPSSEANVGRMPGPPTPGR